MRVLIINTSERIGGAAVAAGRLMESLKNNGIKAKMLVRDKQTDQISVVGLKGSWLHVWKFMWERIVIWKANRFKKNDLFAVDIANTGTDITSLPEFQQADVIHLHWINQGMLSLNTIRKILTSGKPVVWTMHDMWPCTGICHYARECRNYEQECHHCPYIYGGGGKKDLSTQISVVGLKGSWLHVWKFMWERIVIWKANRFKKNDLFAVDIANTGTDITSLPEFQQADVIHLHWINQGMLSLNTIRKILTSGKPVVWTMHDMWPCTGICHYARECRNYEQECHHCPYIYGGGGKKDLSTRIFRKKKEIYSQASITFVGCSRWLAEKAKVSGLLTGQTVISIPNAINTNLFKPHNKQEARRKCRLPQEGKLILFGSVKITDKRKGIDYLIEACKLLAEKHPEWKDSLGVVVFGNQSQQLQDLIPFRVYPLPYIKNEHELVDIYNAVDLFVIPSLEENLPNMVMEAMSCGVPCVGFNTGGIPEMIDHLHNGYVAQRKSSEDLANGIHWVLTEPEYAELSAQACRKAIGNYSESIIAKKYTDVYNKITGKYA